MTTLFSQSYTVIQSKTIVLLCKEAYFRGISPFLLKVKQVVLLLLRCYYFLKRLIYRYLKPMQKYMMVYDGE